MVVFHGYVQKNSERVHLPWCVDKVENWTEESPDWAGVVEDFFTVDTFVLSM